MFNEKEIQDKLNSLAMEALEEMYQDGIDKSFNHVEEIKIYETEGLRRNLKAQISSIKSLMSAARERGDESAVKEYESHLENLRSKRNSVKENTLYTFENGEIVEFVDELSEGVDDYNEKMNSDVEKIRQNNPKSTVHNVGTKVTHKPTSLGGHPMSGKVGVVNRVEDHGAGMIAHFVRWPKKRKDTMHWGSWLQPVEHEEFEDINEEFKAGDKVTVHPQSYPTMKWHGVVKGVSTKGKKYGSQHYRVEYEHDSMFGGKTKSTDTFHVKELKKHVEESDKTLWDEKKNKWLEKFTKDQKEKKKDKEVNEAARHYVYKHWPDLNQFVQVGKKGGYASKEEAEKHAEKFNANKDEHEIPHHYKAMSIGVVKEDEQLDEELPEKDPKGVKYRVMSGYDGMWNYKGDKARDNAMAHYHSLIKKEPKGTHALYRSTVDHDGKIASKPIKSYERGKHVNEEQLDEEDQFKGQTKKGTKFHIKTRKLKGNEHKDFTHVEAHLENGKVHQVFGIMKSRGFNKNTRNIGTVYQNDTYSVTHGHPSIEHAKLHAHEIMSNKDDI